MHNAVIMDVLQSRTELPSAFKCLFNSQLAAFLKKLLQSSAADDLHAVKQPVAIETVVVARHDVWMIELMKNLDLPFETLPDGFVLRNSRLQNLQCNLSAVCSIDGSADRAHRTDAECFAELK